MRTTHDFILRMNRVPGRTTSKWRRLKKEPIWRFATETDRIETPPSLRDLLLMAERERRRAWRTVFLYQTILARFARGEARAIELKPRNETEEFHCPRCGKKSTKYTIGRDGYLSCPNCVPGAPVLLEAPLRRHRQ